MEVGPAPSLTFTPACGTCGWGPGGFAVVAGCRQVSSLKNRPTGLGYKERSPVSNGATLCRLRASKIPAAHLVPLASCLSLIYTSYIFDDLCCLFGLCVPNSSLTMTPSVASAYFDHILGGRGRAAKA